MSAWKNSISLVARYVGGGFVNTGVGFAVIFFLTALGVDPVVSNLCGYLVGFMLGFILSKKIVFRSNGRLVGESARYITSFVFSFVVNLIVLKLSLSLLHLMVIEAQVAAAGAYTVTMFVLCRWWVFSVRRAR